jgi:hypothetical protein
MWRHQLAGHQVALIKTGTTTKAPAGYLSSHGSLDIEHIEFFRN